ncbi:peptidoglycan DD-metalloendopeptidase family protein [Cryomorphaceae bacterium S-15]|uniref:Peptidoglycan DD-metalloendopeptidase family protein n=2 Tax=Acidiluteibacter ferrifornacis TaxID=2692424 RepID=A0A6N9NGX6_9FLAO|nr:peptidoglycan DD-metalloendopeptidase family protein [Acidiluteibacter ferrifornacis]
MNRYFINSCFFICVLIAPIILMAQGKSELQQKKKELQKEIIYTNKLLDETAENKKASISQLLQLSKKISAREELIQTMNQEIVLIDKSIDSNQVVLDSLTNTMKLLKDEYAKILQSAYKNRSAYDQLMFVFSSEDFNQAFKRLKYLQQFTRYRKNQVLKIEFTQGEINEKITQLEAIRLSKKNLLASIQNEYQKLGSEKNQKQNVVNQLQGKEKELKAQLAEKKKASQKLEKAIERIIEEEIRKAKEAAKKAGKDSKGYPLTPEAKELSNSFTANQGKLPWPVVEGLITEKFGEHPHPALPGVKVQNNGIDISTTKGSVIRSIFEGEVTAVIIIPGGGKGVMIRHGEYLSVYTYFQELFVKKGDKVSTKQDLGIVVTDDDNKTNLHLEIWKNTTKLNPELWIYRK